MCHNPEKYFQQRVLDLKDGTVLPFTIDSSSPELCCSLHKAFTEGSIPLLCHYFNNQSSQSNTLPSARFPHSIIFSKHTM